MGKTVRRVWSQVQRSLLTDIQSCSCSILPFAYDLISLSVLQVQLILLSVLTHLVLYSNCDVYMGTTCQEIYAVGIHINVDKMRLPSLLGPGCLWFLSFLKKISWVPLSPCSYSSYSVLSWVQASVPSPTPTNKQKQKNPTPRLLCIRFPGLGSRLHRVPGSFHHLTASDLFFLFFCRLTYLPFSYRIIQHTLRFLAW